MYRRSVYASVGKVHFGKCSRWSWPWKCDLQCHVGQWVIVVRFIKMRPLIPETRERMPPRMLIWPRGLAVTLTFDLLTSKSNQFIFVANFIEVVHFFWNSNKRFLRYRVNRLLLYDCDTDSLYTECLRRYSSVVGRHNNFDIRWQCLWQM